MDAAERQPRVCVVIVNYRTAGLVVDCLRSLEGERRAMGGRLRVIVTDNASPDDSVERLNRAVEEHGWRDWVRIMPLGKNGGFAYGNNEGIRAAMRGEDRPDYVHLLNPDTVVREGAVRELVGFMEGHPRVGVAGSRCEDPDGTAQRSARRFPGVLSEFEEGIRLAVVSRVLASRIVCPAAREEAHRTGWVVGASMMVRTEMLREVGMMDEGYFMYFEEVDFCRRAADAGWECWYVPTSRVVHLVGQASGVTDPRRNRRRRPAYWFESRRRYFMRNRGWLYTALADAAFAVGYALWRVRRWVQGRPDTDPAALLADFVRHSVYVRGFGAEDGS